MLKVFGHIYANDKNDFELLTNALENDGYQIAYEGETSGSIIKEVQSLNGDDENAES